MSRKDKLLEALMEVYKPPMPKSIREVKGRLGYLTGKWPSEFSEEEVQVCREVYKQLKEEGK